MKTLVALVVTARNNGRRTYTAFDRSKTARHAVTVADCGQGADLAIRAFIRAGFTISFAKWADRLARDICRKQDEQEMLRVERDFRNAAVDDGRTITQATAKASDL